MLRQAENKVKIEGILSEIDIRTGSFTRTDGTKVDTIGGTIKVLVDQNINNKETRVEIPVHMFSTKFKKNGGVNPAYESIERVMNDFASIAAVGNAAQADRVRITNAQIRMNEFPGQNGKIVSQPRIHASFVSKVIGEFKPEASFNLEFMVSSVRRVTDADGVELDPVKLEIQTVVPQYTDDSAPAMNIDVVTLNAENPNVVNAIENYWVAGNCYKANGRLNFSSRTEEVVEEVDFGEPRRSIRTISINEFIVTGGSQAPLDGEFAFDIDEIKAGVAARKQRLEDMKSGKNKQNKQTPPPATGANNSVNLGF